MGLNHVVAMHLGIVAECGSEAMREIAMGLNHVCELLMPLLPLKGNMVAQFFLDKLPHLGEEDL